MMLDPNTTKQMQRRAMTLVLAAGWATGLGLLAVPAGAQVTLTERPAAVKEVEFTVSAAPAAEQLIQVPMNQGVLVDFNQPIAEVRVANATIADVSPTSPKQILINGKAYGTTQLMVVVGDGQQRVLTVAVDLDLKRLQAAIENAIPTAQVRATGMLDTVVLEGTVADAESAERIAQIAGIYSEQVINQIRVAGVQQVLLRCTVAEVNRTATRQLGFNGWIAGDNVPDMFGVQQLNGINPANIGAPKDFPINQRIPFTTGEAGIPLTAAPTLSFGFPKIQMQIFVQALRENGLLKVLAEPNLVTVSGQEAKFLAGGEFPIPVPQDNNSITVEFREFGVRLQFTPTVVSPDVIRMKVAPEVSEPDFTNAVTIGGFVVPGLTQRKVQTVVELGPGQTFAIGGLLSERVRAVSSKVPGLGDLPVLGTLFQSVDYQQSETELVVLVTPELVAPLNPDQIKHIPGSDITAPNDWELFMLGELEGKASASAADGGGEGKAQKTYTGTSTAMRLLGPIGPAGSQEGL